jgi:hypothetical protein
MEKFEPQEMVNWFDANQLANTAVKAALSAVFGTYADKRETIAAISEFEKYDYTWTKDLWIDYIADTGDGFDSTYTMAHLLSQPVVSVKQNNSGTLQLPKARILIFGGDQVYPTATRINYQNRLWGPYEHASFKSESQQKSDLFAVPGNHDWYDGLNNFIKLFSQKRAMGNWQTKQKRSYFAIQLTNNTWLWGIDIQLDADIDKPQLEYFSKITLEFMQEGDQVILCSAEPSWVYHTTRTRQSSYKNLSFFECRYIKEKNLKLILSLAGDQHLYAHYSRTLDDGRVGHKIISGGGGAFMHPTHNLPDVLPGLQDGEFTLQRTFPDKVTSRAMTFGNFKFFYHNWKFGTFMACIYLLLGWFLEIGSKVRQSDLLIELQRCTLSDIKYAVFHLGSALLNSPPAILIILIFVVGGRKFCDTDSSRKKYMGWLGISHGLLHILLMISVFWFFAFLNYNVLHIRLRPLKVIAMIAELLVVGGAMGSWLMAMYLMIANLVFKIHNTESFSSMKIPHYKNFLRMHIKDDVLTIYPVGIKKTAQWVKEGDNFKTTDEVSPELIGEPIIIPLI